MKGSVVRKQKAGAVLKDRSRFYWLDVTFHPRESSRAMM